MAEGLFIRAKGWRKDHLLQQKDGRRLLRRKDHLLGGRNIYWAERLFIAAEEWRKDGLPGVNTEKKNQGGDYDCHHTNRFPE